MPSLAIYCLITLSFGTVLEYSVTEPAFQSFSSSFASSSVLPVASGGVFAFAVPLACDEVAVCEPEVILLVGGFFLLGAECGLLLFVEGVVVARGLRLGELLDRLSGACAVHEILPQGVAVQLRVRGYAAGRIADPEEVV